MTRSLTCVQILCWNYWFCWQHTAPTGLRVPFCVAGIRTWNRGLAGIENRTGLRGRGVSITTNPFVWYSVILCWGFSRAGLNWVRPFCVYFSADFSSNFRRLWHEFDTVSWFGKMMSLNRMYHKISWNCYILLWILCHSIRIWKNHIPEVHFYSYTKC